MKKTICLNMIVKNESQVIERCLSSVKDIIDYWVIVDTGSTDGTQKIIQEFMKDIPGELHERSWVHYAHNRNEALELAKGKGDYLLFIDADEKLIVSEPFTKLDKDYYLCIYRHRMFETEDSDSHRILLVNNHLDWQWEGAIHEALYTKTEEVESGFLDNAMILATMKDGARTKDKDKYLKDAIALEKELEKDPLNERAIYHLAMTYVANKKYSLAIENFEKKIALGGAPVEIYFCLYQKAVCQDLLDMDMKLVIDGYVRTYHNRSSRAEPLSALAHYFIKNELFLLGYLVAEFSLPLSIPDDNYFTQHWIYNWGLLHQYAHCAIHIGKKKESLDAFHKLISIPNIPDSLRQEVENALNENDLS